MPVKLSPRQMRWAAWAGAWTLRLLDRTVRWRIYAPESTRALLAGERPVILSLWHGRLLMIPTAYLRTGRRQVNVLVSEHGDGELISRTIAHLGLGSVRGSSRRGALRGMRELIRKARQGSDFAFTPDGPRGPAFQVQAGVVDFARRTGYPVLPVTFSARGAKEFDSWDRFMVPRPFTRGVVSWGEPHWVEQEADTETVRRELEADMRELTEEADRLAGRKA